MQRRQFLSSATLVAAAAAIPGAAEAEDAGAVVERFAAALSAHDMAAFADLFAEDYVNHQGAAPRLRRRLENRPSRRPSLSFRRG